ncbi:MAG: hypothetical protein JXP73_13610 [Deltaproteobacteria bacterium]|nr:hypothetical protein [Deltaproteobacteria bacterium]
MKKPTSTRSYVLCVRNDGYPASLLVRRLYRRLPDRGAAARGLIRVVDESGEDYLYPEKLFVPITLSRPVARAMQAAA